MGGRDARLIAEARVATERPSRYLVQLCRHVNKVSERDPQMQAHVDWSDDHGVISFGWGRCTLRADPGVLTLRAEAPDEESLRRLEHRVTDRLEWFGRRDQLTVIWTPPQGAGEQLPRQPPPLTQEDTHMADPPRYPDTGDDTGVGPGRGSATGTRSWVGKVFLIIALVLVLLFVLLHLTGTLGPGVD
jgi:hypothetical protein